MLRVGLTGGIGSGKSEVSARFAALGAVVVDADRLAREVVAPGTDGLAAVVATFGPAVLHADGGLDRERVAGIVFSDPGARERLNAVVHPRVRAATAAAFRRAPADAIVVNDVPLLVETGLAPTYHLVVVVDAPEPVRLDRLLRLRSMSEPAARARLASQAGDEERRAAADVVLDNGAELARLDVVVERLWSDRLVPYGANLRAARVAPRPGVVLVGPDPGWPAAYGRIAARLQNALGEQALRVEHVGSTAVPGLAARDVVDVQVSVASTAAAGAVREVLADAGYPPVPGRDDPEPSDPEPVRFQQRLHGSADPGRPVDVHLRPAGSTGERSALLFRDWLRAEAGERVAYGREKRRLAAGARTEEAYLRGKEPWLDAALPRAEVWAGRSGWQPG